MDQVDFQNTMRTLGWSSQAVQGFEADAYGAALCLIHYIDHLTPAGRIAWANASMRASHIGQQGIRRTREGSYLSWLNQLRMSVYGLGFDDESVTKQTMRVSNPWSLSDAEFTYCMLYIRTGREPDTDKFQKKYLAPLESKVAGKLTDTLEGEALKYLETAAITLGGAAIGAFFKFKNSTIGGAVIGFAFDMLKETMAKQMLADLTARYESDEARRLYLVPKGLSSYVKVAALP